MPNVPRVPGVPPLLSYASGAISLLANQALQTLAGLALPQWGLFKDGVPVVAADTVTSFDLKRSWAVADYPLEPGSSPTPGGTQQPLGFESYDKVALPFEVKLRFAAGGSEIDRQALIDSVEAIAGTLTLFDAASPEAVYQNVNVTHYDYRRTSINGVGIVVIDVWCVEVRVSAQSAFPSTKAPSGASAVNGGTVQAQPPTLSQSSQLPLVM